MPHAGIGYGFPVGVAEVERAPKISNGGISEAESLQSTHLLFHARNGLIVPVQGLRYRVVDVVQMSDVILQYGRCCTGVGARAQTVQMILQLALQSLDSLDATVALGTKRRESVSDEGAGLGTLVVDRDRISTAMFFRLPSTNVRYIDSINVYCSTTHTYQQFLLQLQSLALSNRLQRSLFQLPVHTIGVIRTAQHG